MDYKLFYTGLASTPFTVGLKCTTTNEIICEINVSMPKGSDTRKRYEKMLSLLRNKYQSLLTN
jgi:hypothetical protein